MIIKIKNRLIYNPPKVIMDASFADMIAVANGFCWADFVKEYMGQELSIDDKTLKIIPNSIRFIRSLKGYET